MIGYVYKQSESAVKANTRVNDKHSSSYSTSSYQQQQHKLDT